MVKIFKASQQTKATGQVLELDIERLDNNGLGVAKYKGKPVFVAETLPSEKVKVRVVEHKNKYMKAKLLSVTRQNPNRVDVQCRHFSQCGGCDLQHLSIEQQRAFKQQKITELFNREKIHDLPWQPAIYDEHWHYRRKARIGVQFDKRGDAIIGFRKKLTNELTPIKNCPVLEPVFADVFVELKAVIAQLKQFKAIGHVEIIASAERKSIIIRQLAKLIEHDKNCWLAAANEYDWHIFIDDGDTISPLDSNETATLSYALNEQLNIHFRPDDFIQVNAKVNQKMVAQAVNWLALSSHEQVLDLFCGIDLLSNSENEFLSELDESLFNFSTEEIDWSIALTRAGNKVDLAKDLLSGLVNSLPETKLHIMDALTSQDIEQAKMLIHKLNGACCYTGVPLLGKITHQIETDLKQGKSLDDLEPEFFEFFEHIDNIVEQTPGMMKEINEAVH